MSAGSGGSTKKPDEGEAIEPIKLMHILAIGQKRGKQTEKQKPNDADGWENVPG
jgi:hypothetical protein